MPNTHNSKDDFAKTVSLFLAELLRTRQINLRRAAEIAEKVSQNINLLDTEKHFLDLIVELHKDFDELSALEGRMHLQLKKSERELLEHMVHQYAVHAMGQDVHTAHEILQDAIKDEHNFETLSAKYPKFKEFIQTNDRN